MAETLVSLSLATAGTPSTATQVVGTGSWCGWSGDVSTLLGPERTTSGCCFSALWWAGAY